MLSPRPADPDEDIFRRQEISGGLINIPSFRSRLKERSFIYYQSTFLLGEYDKVTFYMDMYEAGKPELMMGSGLWPVKV